MLQRLLSYQSDQYCVLPMRHFSCVGKRTIDKMLNSTFNRNVDDGLPDYVFVCIVLALDGHSLGREIIRYEENTPCSLHSLSDGFVVSYIALHHLGSILRKCLGCWLLCIASDRSYTEVFVGFYFSKSSGIAEPCRPVAPKTVTICSSLPIVYS